MTKRTFGSLAVLATTLTFSTVTQAQDVLVDTGAGNTSTVGGLSAFNDSGNGFFQFVGMKVSFAEDVEIGRIDAWINGFGGIDVRLRANTGGLPGAVIEEEPGVGFFVSPTNWLMVPDLFWNVSAGDYWITFEFEPDAGNATFPVGVPNPLSGYAFLADGNPGWSNLGGSFPMGLRVYTTAPPEPVLVPSEFPTIQSAIDFVSSGQVIEVAPGTYNEAINYFGKSIKIQSAGGPGVTTIDATGLNQPAVRVPSGSGASTRLEGFTITGGNHLTNFATGGGLFAQGNITVNNCNFVDNIAESGGGAAVSNSAEVFFNDCTFDNNDNTALFASAGGVYVNDGTAHFDSCTFKNNDVSSGGGAININVGGTATATDCTFINNTSANAAGAVMVIGSGANGTFTGCLFQNNTAQQAGGVMVNSATASFTNCNFKHNIATFAGSTAGGGLQAQGSANVTIAGCDFINNQAFFGGGVQYINVTGTKTITGSRFRNNSADNNGGGISVIGRSPSVGTTEFCGNTPNHLGGSISDTGGNTFSATCIPDNNTPAQPEPVTLGIGVAATFEGASNSGTSSCEPDGPDLFYEFTVINGPTSVIVSTCGSSADTALAVFDEGDNEAGCSTSCGGSPCTSTAACLLLTNLDNGTYTIRVSLESGVVAGATPVDFVLEIDEAELAIPGDFNNDMVVDQDDRTLLCAALGSMTGDANFIEAADFDDNGVINQLDQAQFNSILPPCVGDLVMSGNFQPPGDGLIDGADLAILLGAWGNSPSCADFVNSDTFLPPPDGKVDGADLALLLGAWGTCK